MVSLDDSPESSLVDCEQVFFELLIYDDVLVVFCFNDIERHRRQASTS